MTLITDGKGKGMNRKSILGLIAFGLIITIGLFIWVNFIIHDDINITDDQKKNGSFEDSPVKSKSGKDFSQNKSEAHADTTDNATDNATANSRKSDEPWLASNPTDTGMNQEDETDKDPVSSPEDDFMDEAKTAVSQSHAGNGVAGGKILSMNIEPTDKIIDEAITEGDIISHSPDLQLIFRCDKVNYEEYLPETASTPDMDKALDIMNPEMDITAEAAILLDTDTKSVLYYKNPIKVEFPASTAKLLTCLVALDWCKEEEQVTVGDEIKMIAPDSSRAYLNQGEILSIRNLLAGMLLPSGNDAAYATAVYVGRKSLQDVNASREDAVTEFSKLMNIKAQELGAKNSCFKSPDGYDAIGQYTTAYDMGMIALAAANNPTICEISRKSSARNIFISGEDVTWNTTNSLIKKGSQWFYSYAVGLKTGTSSLAGRCIVAAAKKDEKEVVCVIMDASSAGRWEDAITLLKYGLNQ